MLVALPCGAFAVAGALAACGGKITDERASTSDGDGAAPSLDGSASSGPSDGSTATDAGTTTYDPPRVVWDASPEAAPADLGYYPSTCIVRSGAAPPPESPYVGPGYARVPTTARTLKDLVLVCTDDVYTRLMPAYCASTGASPVQWSVLMYYGTEASGCAATGCDTHRCP